MTTNSELREDWAKSVYSNFSTHDCIRNEIIMLNKAIEVGDDVLVDFLKINILRRKKRAAGISIEPEYRLMIDFYEKNRNSIDSSNVILSALAARVSRCASRPYFPTLPDSIKLDDLLIESSKIVNQYCTDFSQYFVREVAASVKVALINERSNNLKNANESFDKYNQLIIEIDDYLPAYFDRASFALKVHHNNAVEMPGEKVISFFASTVEAAAKFDKIHLPKMDDIKALEEYISIYCTPNSALPLALRELSIAQAVCTDSRPYEAVDGFLLSNLNKMENNRFDKII